MRGCGGSFVYVVLWLLGSGTRNGDGKQGGEQQAGVGAGRTRGAGDGVRRASRASLAARKNYRKAEDIDLKLPQASTALGGAPRMRKSATTLGRRRAAASGRRRSASTQAASRTLARGGGHSEGSDGPGRPVWRLLRAVDEQEGHGEFVRWQRQAQGTLKQIVVPVRDEATKQIKVPEPETFGEYFMVMAVGDTDARPKGGTEEYRTS